MLHLVAGLLSMVSAAPSQDALHQHVSKLGGTVERLEWFKEEIKYQVKLRGAKITDDDLAELAKWREIHELDLAFTPIKDAGLVHIGRMAGLRHANLIGTKVTDAGLDELVKAPLLDSVDLAKTAVTAKGVQKLIEKRLRMDVCRVALGDKSQYRAIESYQQGRLSETRLMIGDTLYGVQFAKLQDGKGFSPDGKDRSQIATTYYHKDGPVGQVMSKFDWFPGPKGDLANLSNARLPASLTGMMALGSSLRLDALTNVWSEPAIGVIRVTAGTHAAYGRPGMQIHFYNSTPEIAEFSLPPKGQPRMFEYIHDAQQRGCQVKVIDGDERTMLGKKGPKKFYSALFVDVTRTDLRDINTQLFTKEAIAEFMDTMTDKGILCYHTSHRYHGVIPPLVDAAKDLGLVWGVCEDKGSYDSIEDRNNSHFSSEWVMIARKGAYMDHLKDTKTMTWKVPVPTGAHLWRDGGKHDLDALKRDNGK